MLLRLRWRDFWVGAGSRLLGYPGLSTGPMPLGGIHIVTVRRAHARALRVAESVRGVWDQFH